MMVRITTAEFFGKHEAIVEVNGKTEYVGTPNPEREEAMKDGITFAKTIAWPR